MFLIQLLSWGLALTLSAYLFELIRIRLRVITHLQKLPGPPKCNIFVGNLKELQTTPEQIFKIIRRWSREYQPIYKMWFILETGANLCTPEDCELVLSNQKHIQKSKVYNLLTNWMGTGLLTSRGNKWQQRRKILTPTFHFSILQEFVAVFNEQTDNLVGTLKGYCDKPFAEINDDVTQFALKTIGETAMGTKFSFTTKKEREYKNAIFAVADILVYKMMRPWLYYDLVNISYVFYSNFYKERRLTNILHKFTTDVVEERQKKFQDVDLATVANHEVYSKKKRLAMLDLMISAKNENGSIDDEGIREEVDTFMFEGHDTTAAALTFALMLLACNQHAQEKIVEELHEVLGDLTKRPTYNDLQNLKYMDRCIKEVLRLYPSVHYISRELGEDLMTHSGFLLPKHSIAHIHVYDLHHNPDIYPDPEKFDPDRFLPENFQKRHPFAYLPFSAGSRNCIGQKFAVLELKAALCGILGNFILQPVDTPESIVLVVDLVLRTKRPIKVKILPRRE